MPTEGELFDEVEFIEQDESEARRTVDGYHREGKRSRERGVDESHKRQRYDHDRQGPRHAVDRYGKFAAFVWYIFGTGANFAFCVDPAEYMANSLHSSSQPIAFDFPVRNHLVRTNAM